MLKQRFLVDFGSKLFIYFLTSVAGILVSRIAGPEVIGTIGYATSFVSMFFFIFALFGTAHIKIVSEGENARDSNIVYTIIIFATLILFVSLVLGYMYIQKNFFDKPFTETEEIVIYLTIVLIGLKGLFKIPEITFTALLEQVKINFPKLIQAVVYNVGRIIVVLLGFKAIALVSVNVLSSIVILPIYIYLMKKDFLAGKWNNDLFKRYLQIGFPILIINFTMTLTGNYAIVLFKDFSSVIELGYFFGATSLASMLIMIGGTAGSLFFPLFSKAFSEKKFGLIKDQIFKYERFLFLFVLPIIIILSVNAYTIIPFLLGDQYFASVPIFSILVFFSFIKIWGMPYYNLINGINKFNLNAIIHVFFTVVYFVILYFMTHRDYLNLGGLGLAITMLSFNIVKLSIWYFFANKTIDVKFDKSLLKFTIFSIVVYFMGKFVFEYFIFDLNYWLKFAFLLLYTVFIYTSLYLIGLMQKSDVEFIIKLINVKALSDYFKSELKRK